MRETTPCRPHHTTRDGRTALPPEYIAYREWRVAVETERVQRELQRLGFTKERAGA